MLIHPKTYKIAAALLGERAKESFVSINSDATIVRPFTQIVLDRNQGFIGLNDKT